MPASYRLRLHWRKNLVPFQNDLTFLTTRADGTLAEATEILVGFTGAPTIISTLMDLVPTDVTLEAIACQSVVANGGSATGSSNAVVVVNLPGTRAPASSTGQTSNQSGPICAYMPEVQTGERARVCKMFVPTVNESDAEDDKIGSSLETAMLAFFTALQVGFTVSSGAVSWVAMLKIGGVATIRGLIGFFIRTYIASQRRRRPPAFG